MQSTSLNSPRRVRKAAASSRDTCICDMPSRSPIWLWVMVPKKPHRDDVPFPAGQFRQRRVGGARSGSPAYRLRAEP